MTTSTNAPPSVEADDKQSARLRIEVEWADIVKTSGDVFVVGHYVGVLPQYAELALDRALSRVEPDAAGARSEEDARLILTNLTRRGAIRGALGDIIFFPWKGKGQIVLAGMGRLGTFKEPQLKLLAGSLAQSVARLIPNPVICTVLIGAGFGNLEVPEAVSGLIAGVASALQADASLTPITLRIVEFQLDRAYEILGAVIKESKSLAEESGLEVSIESQVIEHDDTGGVIPIPFGFSLLLASLAQACHDGDDSRLKPSVDALVSELPMGLQPGVKESLRRLGQQRNPKQLGLAFRMSDPSKQRDATIADRMSFSHDGARIQSAAITNLTTVSATTLEVSLSWIDRIVEALRAPSEDVFKDRGGRALRSLVHPLLREKLLLTEPLVLELDRTMARVPWELVHGGKDPLSVMRPVARQLRTTYSPRPSDVAVRPTWKALVIGNPDGTLEKATTEAKVVYQVLKDQELEVDLRIGPPDVLGLGTEPGIEPADLYEILELLQSGEYDIVHFAGHAFFTAEFPDRSGWAFKDDVLTASKLEGIERPPRLIVANACVSAAISNQFAARVPTQAARVPAQPGAVAPPPATDHLVVASLADEFFRRGVADYIGTAWEVPDEPARLFAARLYRTLFTGWKKQLQSRTAPSLGLAVQEARTELYRRRVDFGEHASMWAAYQHYGDPTRRLADYRT